MPILEPHVRPSYYSRALHELLLDFYPDGGVLDLPTVDGWRARDRQKTVAAALVLCLNVGVDPPDVVKPEPCARLECWLDPASMPAQKALEAIGKALQAQYECAWMHTPSLPLILFFSTDTLCAPPSIFPFARRLAAARALPALRRPNTRGAPQGLPQLTAHTRRS